MAGEGQMDSPTKERNLATNGCPRRGLAQGAWPMGWPDPRAQGGSCNNVFTAPFYEENGSP